MEGEVEETFLGGVCQHRLHFAFFSFCKKIVNILNKFSSKDDNSYFFCLFCYKPDLFSIIAKIADLKYKVDEL